MVVWGKDEPKQCDGQTDRQADKRLTYPESYHWRVRVRVRHAGGVQAEKAHWFVVSSD